MSWWNDLTQNLTSLAKNSIATVSNIFNGNQDDASSSEINVSNSSNNSFQSVITSSNPSGQKPVADYITKARSLGQAYGIRGDGTIIPKYLTPQKKTKKPNWQEKVDKLNPENLRKCANEVKEFCEDNKRVWHVREHDGFGIFLNRSYLQGMKSRLESIIDEHKIKDTYTNEFGPNSSRNNREMELKKRADKTFKTKFINVLSDLTDKTTKSLNIGQEVREIINNSYREQEEANKSKSKSSHSSRTSIKDGNEGGDRKKSSSQKPTTTTRYIESHRKSARPSSRQKKSWASTILDARAVVSSLHGKYGKEDGR